MASVAERSANHCQDVDGAVAHILELTARGPTVALSCGSGMTDVHDGRPDGRALLCAMRGCVLIVEDDPVLAEVVAEIVEDEGFAVSVLNPLVGAIQEQVTRLEPDLVLLDGGDGTGYGSSWIAAAWLHERTRPIPVIMFTAHATDLAEAQLGDSERSQKAAFVGFLSKPFDVEALVDILARAVPRPVLLLRTAESLRGQVSQLAVTN